MRPLEVHTCVSPSHRRLADEHLRPTFAATTNGDATLRVHSATQHCPSGRYGDPGWLRITREKLEVARAAAESTPDDEAFAVCDADVAFLAPWVGPALETLNGHDLVAMDEPGFGPALWLARSGPRVRAMLDDLLARWGRWPGDGAALRDGVAEHGLAWDLLDRRFATPGNLGHPLPLMFGRATFTPPPGTLIFHANYCLAGDKRTLLAEVRRIAKGGERPANDALTARGPVGLGFFPAQKPDRPFDRQSMLARSKARDILGFVGDRPVRLIVEVGSWLGASTRWLLETFSGPPRPGLEHEHAEIVCIDTWEGLAEWDQSEFRSRTERAWEQFCANCWHLRQFITPIRLPSRDGLPAIIWELERQDRAPDLVYVDGDHTYESCLADTMTAAEAWPEALILGGDHGLERRGTAGRTPIRGAAEAAAGKLGRVVRVGDSGVWALTRA